MTEKTNLNKSVGSSPLVWDRTARSYEAQRQSDPVYLSCIRQAASVIPPGTRLCLDAGCGTGMTTKTFSPHARLVIALDYSHEALKVLKEKGIANVSPIQADIRHLPFKNSVFDVSICANTLQHLRPGEPQQEAIAELRRVTKNKGVLTLSVHHYSKAKRRAGWIKEGKPGEQGVDYIFRFSKDDVSDIIPGARITGIGYYGLSRIPYLGMRMQDLFARMIGRVAAKLGYGHMLLAVQENKKGDG